MLKKVAFTMYPVIDMQRARNFYEQILGLQPGAVSGQGGWVEYDLPAGGCFAITTFAENIAPSKDAGGTIAFEVEDLDALVTKLKQQDVEILMDNVESPVCRMTVISDSEGNSLILHKLHEKK